MRQSTKGRERTIPTLIREVNIDTTESLMNVILRNAYMQNYS